VTSWGSNALDSHPGASWGNSTASNSFLRPTGDYEKNTEVLQDSAGKTLANMKRSTFWLILGLVSLAVIGISVGGAVGGTISANKNNNSQAQAGTSTTTSSTSVLPSSTPTTRPQPTSDCPGSNGTTYNSAYLGGTSPGPPSAGLRFTKFCSSSHAGVDIGSGFFQTFDECIELCASLNYWAENKVCKMAVFEPTGKFPANCWTHNTTGEMVVDKIHDTAVLI
jgi:hypothetical protein